MATKEQKEKNESGLIGIGSEYGCYTCPLGR